SVHVDRGGAALLGFRFLRTGPGESSPGIIANEDGSLLMICDGHVVNSDDLQAQLRVERHEFTGPHSGEILLHLYEGEGPAGWRKADGQFALAIWDQRAKKLVLGRDFLGVRPLYFCSVAGGIVFASEIKSLLRHSGVPRDVDVAAVADFL